MGETYELGENVYSVSNDGEDDDGDEGVREGYEQDNREMPPIQLLDKQLLDKQPDANMGEDAYEDAYEENPYRGRFIIGCFVVGLIAAVVLVILGCTKYKTGTDSDPLGGGNVILIITAICLGCASLLGAFSYIILKNE